MYKNIILEMKIRTNGDRFKMFQTSEFYKKKRKNEAYDYETNGILVNIMSTKITESENIILKQILNFCEKSLLFLLKYTTELKHFKNIHQKNR